MPTKYIPTEEELNTILTLYANGTSIREMSKIVHKTRPVLARILKENEVHIRMSDETSRKYTFNERFFEKIDSEEKAYWLGFLYADGYITSPTPQRNQSFGINLAIEDIAHVEKFKKSLEATYPVNVYSNEWGSFANAQDIARLLIASQKAVNDLKKLGCVEKKTKVLTFPTEEQVPHEFIYDFIRGYIDGDGTIYVDKRGAWSFGCLGTYDIVKNIRDLLKLEVIISEEHPERCKGIYSFKAGGLKYFNSLNLLYGNATIYLDRKYEKFLEIKKKYSESQGI